MQFSKEESMSFLKNSWGKIVIACLTGTAAVLFFIAMITAPEVKFLNTPSFSLVTQFSVLPSFCLFFSIFIFFAGTTSYLICKLFGPTRLFSKYILLVTGLIATVFLTIVLIDSFSLIKDVNDNKTLLNIANSYDKTLWTANFYIYAYLAQLIVFGLIPLIRGIHQVVGLFIGNDKAGKKPTRRK